MMNRKRKFSELTKFEYETVCFSDYFCNKLYYRSLKNDKQNILCKKANSFAILKNILSIKIGDAKNESLTEKLLPHTWEMCNDLKNNFKERSKKEFEPYFVHLKNRGSILPVACEDITKVIIGILEAIVRKDFYGCPKNKKAFYELTRHVLKGMAGQHITMNRILNKWDIGKVEWLNAIEENSVKNVILAQFLVFILKNTVCSILAVNFYVTTTRLTHETRRLYFYFKSDWQKVTEDYLFKLIKSGDISKHENISNGRRYKRKLSLAVRKSNKASLKALPVMCFMLKPNAGVRVIVRYRKRTLVERKAEKSRRNLFKSILPHIKSKKIEEMYTKLYQKWIASNKPKLYFVKIDLFDAFGSVDIKALKSILGRLHSNYQNVETNVERKKSASKEHHKLIKELNNPILVRYGSCAYEWKHGLVQGMKYSPILCEIFYDNFDSNLTSIFENNLTDDIQFFIRLVDDYLFITNNRDNAIKFLTYMSGSGKINHKKTVTNFENEHCEYDSDIKFYGHVFNMNTLEVTRDETVYKGNVRYRITFNRTISNPTRFLKQRIGQTTVPLSPLYFSLLINSETTIWKNIFVSLCISANRFCTILSHIHCNTTELNVQSLFKIYKEKISVKMCDFIIQIINEQKPKGVYFEYCANHFRYISYRALNVFASKSNVCSKLLPYIKIYLKKTNCMSGVWKTHYKTIHQDGHLIHKAEKRICRRMNFENFISEFDKICTSLNCDIS